MRRSEKKKDDRKRLFMSLFIVGIMTMSVLGYMIGRDSEDQLKYNGFKFVRINNKFVTKIAGTDFAFDYFPSNVENINVSDDIIAKIKNNAQIDSTYDLEDPYKETISLFQFELSNALIMNNQFMRKGFTTENEFSLPIITCNDATSQVPVIMLQKSNETIIYEEDNCIIVKAKTAQDIIALKDKIIYNLLGII